MQQYKNTGVYLASSSAIAVALKEKNPKAAEQLFRECGERFEKQYPIAEHRNWMMAMSKGSPRPIITELGPTEASAASTHVYELEALAFQLKINLGYGALRPAMHLTNDVKKLREQLEEVRHDFSSFMDDLTFESRQLVQNCPSWRVATLLY